MAGHADLNIGVAPAGFSVEFWIKSDRVGLSDYPILGWNSLSAGDGTYIFGNNGGQNAYLHLQDVGGGGYDINASDLLVGERGNWVHLAYTYDKVSGVARIYKNGSLKLETILPAGLTAQTGPDYRLWVGSKPNDYARFKGAIDELSLYNKPLSFAEVQAIYDSAAIGKAPLNGNHAPVISFASTHLTQNSLSGITVLNAIVIDGSRHNDHKGRLSMTNQRIGCALDVQIRPL